MKRLRKHIIPWTLAVLMALTCGASAAFAGEDVQPVEGEAVGDTVSVEAEQSGVSQEDENADVSLEDENFGDGEPQTEETDNARLGDGSKETNPTVKVNYGGFIERVQDSVRVFPGETAGFTTKLLRFESNEETEYWSVKKVDDYIVKWIVVQTDKENGGEATINYYSTSVSKDTKRLDVTVNKVSIPCSGYR